MVEAYILMLATFEVLVKKFVSWLWRLKLNPENCGNFLLKQIGTNLPGQDTSIISYLVRPQCKVCKINFCLILVLLVHKCNIHFLLFIIRRHVSASYGHLQVL
jgi:hypothetical protein